MSTKTRFWRYKREKRNKCYLPYHGHRRNGKTVIASTLIMKSMFMLISKLNYHTCIYPKYWDTQTLYYILFLNCKGYHFTTISPPVGVFKCCWMSAKQYRPWSDGVWSESTLFAQAYLSHYLGLLRYLAFAKIEDYFFFLFEHLAGWPFILPVLQICTGSGRTIPLTHLTTFSFYYMSDNTYYRSSQGDV